MKNKSSVDGYEFHGWQKDGQDVQSFTMPENNVVLIGWFNSGSGTETVRITYRSDIQANDPDYDKNIPDPLCYQGTATHDHSA